MAKLWEPFARLGTAVLEVLEWTENGPDFATTLEDAAVRVLKKLDVQQGANR